MISWGGRGERETGRVARHNPQVHLRFPSQPFFRITLFSLLTSAVSPPLSFACLTLTYSTFFFYLILAGFFFSHRLFVCCVIFCSACVCCAAAGLSCRPWCSGKGSFPPTLRAFFPGSQGQASQMSTADTQLSKDCIPGSKHLY